MTYRTGTQNFKRPYILVGIPVPTYNELTRIRDEPDTRRSIVWNAIGQLFAELKDDL